MRVVTSDGVTIYGEPYFGELDENAPLVLLFHQGGANGRGEYATLAGWLNAEGFRAIAWDQRRGGSMFGQTNRTLDGLETEPPDSYCDVYPDLQAALDYVLDHGFADSAVLWGSSYSGALVFRLAAENRRAVSGVVSFSPAAGDPMMGCEARQWASDLRVPMLALRPGSEMALPDPAEQRQLLIEAGVEFHVVERGVHGSSMLLDERTGADMATARLLVASWLRNTFAVSGR
jgi:pimeloyl-ACP methyl ester carboxylesterase